MRRKLAALIAVTVVVAFYAAMWAGLEHEASAQGGSPTNPMYVREWQGTGRLYKVVSCTTAGDVAVLTAAEAANMRSLVFVNSDATNYMILCPRAATGGNQCNTDDKGINIWPKAALTIDVSSKDSTWSCMANTATVKLKIYGEMSIPPSPTPSPIPTQSPTPTPTPT